MFFLIIVYVCGYVHMSAGTRGQRWWRVAQGGVVETELQSSVRAIVSSSSQQTYVWAPPTGCVLQRAVRMKIAPVPAAILEPELVHIIWNKGWRTMGAGQDGFSR